MVQEDLNTNVKYSTLRKLVQNRHFIQTPVQGATNNPEKSMWHKSATV